MTTKQIDPRILEAAAHDPILESMIERGEPLTRAQWIIRAHTLSDVPKPWTEEDEQKVPRVFRKRHPDAAD